MKCPNLNCFFVVAELNNVILEFTDVSAVSEGRGPCICCPCELYFHHPGNPGPDMVTWGYRGQARRGEPQLSEVKGQLAERPSKERRVG